MSWKTTAWRSMSCTVGLALATASGCGQHQVIEQDAATEPAQLDELGAEARPLAAMSGGGFRLASHPPRILRLPPPEEGLPAGFELTAPESRDLDGETILPIDPLPPLPNEFEANDFDPEDYLHPEELFPEAGQPTCDIHEQANDDEDCLTEDCETPGRQSRDSVFAAEEYDDDAQLAAEASVDDVLAYFPAENELSAQFRPQVQAAFTLARNGALHAAKDRFETLLAELASAKDASQMTDRHSRALAAGFRALDEADDYLVVGSHRELDTRAIAAGHQTPMLREIDTKWTLPHEAIALYHRYAERKLASAVAGEQAGSMALFGLGKIYQQLAERRENTPQASRKSLTMYRGAVLAHPENHLAANEAGVLLARAGRYEQAEPLLARAAKLANLSTTHQNLAVVHRKLGDTRLAQAHQYQAQRLAAAEMARGQMSAERGVTWMPPQEFNRRSGAASETPIVSNPQPQRLPEQITAPPALPKQSPTRTANERQTMWW